MDGIAARDARVLEILTAPDAYFTRARREAWAKAAEDVRRDLARRAEERKNGARHGSREGPGRVR